MQVLVVYDIPNDKTRTKVADICEDYGLDRIQYSVFQGDLHRVHQEELMSKLKSRLGKQAGKICLYKICQRDWDARIEVLREKPVKEKKESADAAGK